VIAGARRRRRVCEDCKRLCRHHDVVEDALGRTGADAGDQLHDPKPRDPIARVLSEAQHGQQILDVGSLEEFEPTKLDEWDVPPRQFDLEQPAMMRCPEQDRLLLQRQAGFAVFEDAFDDISGLILFIANRNELRQLATGAVRPEVFCIALARLLDQSVCCSKDRLRRSIVPVELSRSPPAG